MSATPPLLTAWKCTNIPTGQTENSQTQTNGGHNYWLNWAEIFFKELTGAKLARNYTVLMATKVYYLIHKIPSPNPTLNQLISHNTHLSCQLHYSSVVHLNVAGFPPRRPKVDIRSIYVWFMADKVALEKFCSRTCASTVSYQLSLYQRSTYTDNPRLVPQTH